MADDVTYLSQAKEAIAEVTGLVPSIDSALKKGEKQVDVRTGVIRTINTMCDALQLACDLISTAISKSVLDYNEVQQKKSEDELRSFFRRTANRFGDGSLAMLLHDGKVCGELHALGDAFRQPFSAGVVTGVSFSEAVLAFFKRSTKMSAALQNLHAGERDYLRSLIGFLADVRNKAELAGGASGDLDVLQRVGEELIGRMRDKRRVMQEQVWALRDAGNECIRKLA
jgi:hypothetical protein